MYSSNADLNTSPKLSPTSSESSLGGLGGPSSITNSANGMTMDVVELQKENARLRKEIEAKETKLNSSMRSIKMFWSPELKKERAARKAEEEKYARLREQFSVVSEESQQRTETIQDLQEQLRQQREERLSGGLSSPVSSSLSLHSQDGLQREVERLRVEKDRQENETFILQKSLEDLSSRLEVQQQAIQAKDETIAQLMEMVQSNKGLESKQLEMHKEQHNSDKRKLAEVLSQLSKLREGIEERDRAICSLQEEIDNARIHNVNDELQQSANLLAKDSHIAELETQISQLEGEVEKLKKTSSEDEEKRQEEKKQTEVFESHSKFMKAKIESLKVDLGKKETALAATETKLQTLQAHQSNQQEHISVLQTSLSTKEHHIKNLQSELESLRGRLDEREEIIKQKEKRLVSISSEHSENSYAVENLQSVLNTKERQITSLKQRCECLEKDLHEKDVTLSNMKTQLSSIKAEHDSSSRTISSLEACIRDKDRHIEMLQNQRQRSGMENEEEVNRVKKAHGKLEARLSSLKGQLTDKEEDLVGLERQISSLKSTVQEKTARLASAEETIKRLEEQVDEAGSKKDHASTELSNKSSEIYRLEKEVKKHQNEVKSKDKEIKRLEEEVKEQQDKVQQLNNECQVKDNKINDLEKQLKEQSKKLAGVKRNQQIEREKHAQLLNEVKKQGDQEDERIEHYQSELQQKESRIAVLEEALTESVSIAAEREELLAQQAQDAKAATSRVEDMESEVERMRIETAVTNTKNASLVLALNENDIILSFYKSERHRMVEELLEMRQNALLATISEKDANIALLELSPTVGSDMEVRKFKAEKDKLVNELKEQTQKRMTLLSNEEDKEISLSIELAQAPKEKILEAVSLIEDSMEKLQQYGEELIEICQKHFPDVLKKLPRLQRRQMSSSEQLKNSTQKQLLDKLESLESDMQLLQENIHKLLELIEDFSDT